jgi:isoquinoline 1-oxidoreductase beta subunit
VLIANAATRLGVPAAELATEPGRVVHAASGRSLDYGEIAAFATLPADLPPVTDKDLKPRDKWRLIGKDVPRVEVPAKVEGKAQFGIDVELPDMLYASILRAPVSNNPHPSFAPDLGIRPLQVDDRAALAIEGVVRVVPLDHGVAVVGTDYWATVLGKRAFKVEWQKGARQESYDSEAVRAEWGRIAGDTGRKGATLRPVGDPEAAFKSAARVIAAVYYSELVYHGAMEPLNATAWVRGDEVDLWSPTQGQTWARDVAAKIAGTVPEKVRVHTTLLGGGFGLKTEQLHNAQAVALAKTMGKPVKVIWSREDDLKHGAYRPAAAQRLAAAIGADGRIDGWHHRVVADSVTRRARGFQWTQFKGYDVIVMVGAATTYKIPHKLHEYVYEERGIPVGY